VFIFDECHRSQFGENHKAIKAFFPNSQLFGFTGTPIFEENATQKQTIQTDGEEDEASFKTSDDLFQRELHAYTITHAIEDQNVLKFHVDYFKPEGKNVADGREPAGVVRERLPQRQSYQVEQTASPDGSRRTANNLQVDGSKPNGAIPKKAIAEAILAKHDAAIGGRRFSDTGASRPVATPAQAVR